VAAVTSVTSDHASDLLRLKGLGPNGVMLPGGTRLRPGDFAGGVLGGADAPVVNPGSLVSGGFGGGF
jgi:hypothetical protein